MKVAFKAIYKAIGFSHDAATKLTDTEVVDSITKLSRITSAHASKICKAIRSPGGADLRGARGCDTGQLVHGVHNLHVSQLDGCIIGEPNGLVHRHEGDFCRHGYYSSDIFHLVLGQGRGVFICNPN